MFFKIAPKVTKYFDNFCIRSCHQELCKIAQSGHTVPNPYSDSNLVTLYLIPTVTQIDVKFSNHLMSASVSLEILDKLVQVFFLLLVRDCRIMKAKPETLHGAVLEVLPEEVGYEESKPLKQEEQADPLVVRLEHDVLLLLDRMIRNDSC